MDDRSLFYVQMMIVSALRGVPVTSGVSGLEGASFTSIHIVTAQVSAFGRMESRRLQGLSLFACGVRKVRLFDSGTRSGTVGVLVRA